MHNAHWFVKSKRIPIICKMQVMEYDDRPETAKRLEQARIARGFATAKDAARYFGWKYETYIQHEQGTRGIPRQSDKYAAAFKVSEAWLLTGEGDGPGAQSKPTIPVVGYVGAGATVFPIDDHSQGDGLDDIPAPPGVLSGVALIVRGDSMWPKYEDGEIIVCERQQIALDSLIGRTCYVQLADGRALLKIINRGSAPGHWTLVSHNAPPIENVVIERAYPIAWTKPRR